MPSVPEGFRSEQGPAGRSWVVREGIPLDLQPTSWDAWMSGKAGTVLTHEGGRSPSRVLHLSGIGAVVVRRYLHGGILAGVTRDLFVGTRRAMQELRASETIRRKGVATPEILALHSRRVFPGLQRLCLLSRLVPEGENLREWIRRGDRGSGERAAMIVAVARELSRFHGAGCHHRDLNASNLLVAGGKIWILDLDGASLKEPLGVGERGGNLLRLYRSLSKESGMWEPLSVRERALFLRHYTGRDRSLFRSLAAWTKSRWAGQRVRSALARARASGSPGRAPFPR